MNNYIVLKTQTGSRPATAATTAATSSRPGSASRPSSASRPGSSAEEASVVPVAGATGSRPGSAKAWAESETSPSSPRSEVSADDNPLLHQEEVPKGCWHSFTHCVGGMWATREMANTNDDREIFVRTTIRELVVYCIFLVVLCLCGWWYSL